MLKACAALISARHLICSELKLLSKRLLSSNVSKKTCLYDFHLAHQGKMVDFCGYLLPVNYLGHGIIESHNHTRNSCSVFDVSHMLQLEIEGRQSIDFIEKLIVADVQSLPINSGCLSVFTNSNGGIIDDLIISRLKDSLYIVSNAACKDKVLKLLNAALDSYPEKEVHLKVLDDRGLIAIQGPRTAEVLQPLTDIDLSTLYFMKTITGEVCGIDDCRLTRCGYTGEDGVELSFPSKFGVALMNFLMQNPLVKPAGLGARDSLRIEAGLCLYGNDIDECISPVEAALSWTIGKRRRVSPDFPGGELIISQLKEKPSQKRIGLTSCGPPARNGCLIFNQEGEKIGYVTSGCPSPTMCINIAMGYVDSKYASPKTQIRVQIRNKVFDGEIVKLPFIPSKYHMMK